MSESNVATGTTNSRSTFNMNKNELQVLDYFYTIDRLTFKKIDVMNLIKTNNKYEILNSSGQTVFFADEENDCFTRNCLESIRPFDIVVTDNMKRNVLNIHRPFRCASCCCFCCFQELMIEDAHQNLLGSVTQDWSIIAPKFSVRDRFGNKVLCVEGPFFPCSFLNDVDFDVLSVNKAQKVGKITKKYSGLGMGRGMYTDSDYFGITFPIDLDVNIKAILLASTFLIDSMFFDDELDDD